ncbi:MAG: hypothetical protein LBJ87_00085, partial [bacterium]|jgi:hypothetical protein|nr:hypothetical protein [bacterium]
VLLAAHPRYVIVTTRLLSEDYGVSSPELVAWLAHNTTPVFTFQGPSDGTLEMFLIPEGSP